MQDIDLVVFQSELNTFSALVQCYEKRQMMLECCIDQNYDQMFILESSNNKKDGSSFSDKAKYIWEKFCHFIAKICQRIRILIKKIKRGKMAKAIRDKLNESKESHNRKKYNIPKNDEFDYSTENTKGIKNSSNPNKQNYNQITKGYADEVPSDEMKFNIKWGTGEIRTALWDYPHLDERIQIQYDTLNSIRDVLIKYTTKTGYTMHDAVRELERESPASDKYNDHMKYYQYSNGFISNSSTYYNTPDEYEKNRLMSEHLKRKPISFNEYCDAFELLEDHMLKLDSIARDVSDRIDVILKSTVYKNDLTNSDDNMPWNMLNVGKTYTRSHKANPKMNPNQHRDVAGKIFDHQSLEDMGRITAHLSYSMNYMISVYSIMQSEYKIITDSRIRMHRDVRTYDDDND